MIIRLRYGEVGRKVPTRTCVDVADITRINLNTVRRTLSDYKYNYYRPTPYVGRGSHNNKQKFTPEHIEFLLDPQFLQDFCSRTLKQRAQIFNEKYPDVTISISTIKRIYKKSRITYHKMNSVYMNKIVDNSIYDEQLINVLKMVDFYRKGKIVSSMRVYFDRQRAIIKGGVSISFLIKS